MWAKIYLMAFIYKIKRAGRKKTYLPISIISNRRSLQLLGDREFVRAVVFVSFAGTQDRIGERFLIRGVWIDLGFQAEAVAVFVIYIITSGEAAVEVVAGVELNTGLVCQYFQDAASGGFRYFCGQGNVAVLIVEDPIVVVAYAVFDLNVVGVDALADWVGSGEVKGSTGDVHEASGGDAGVIGWHHAVGSDGQVVVENVLFASGKVEVAVVGQVEDSRLVGLGFVVDFQSVVIGPLVGDGGVQIAWVSFFAIGAGAGEFEADMVGGLDFFGFPNLFIKAFFATVEMIVPIVGCQCVLVSIAGKFTFSNAVGVSSGDAAKVGVAFKVFFQAVKAEDDRVQFSPFVGYLNVGDDSAVVGNFTDGTIFIGEGVEVDIF